MAARRPASALVVAVVTVAAALAVFSADTWAVAARNWTAAAHQQVGAPVVVTLDIHAVGPVRRALAGLPDDVGRHVTPVARFSGSSVSQLAVVPADFRRISYLDEAGPAQPRPSGVDPWTALVGEKWPRVQITGSRLSVGVGDVDFGAATRPRLVVDVVTDLGRPVSVDLGQLPAGSGRLAAAVPCREGCEVIGIGIRPTVTDALFGRFTLSAARAAGGRTDLTDLPGAFRAEPADPTVANRVTPQETAAGGTGSIVLAVSDANGVAMRAVTRRLPKAYPVIVARTSVYAGEPTLQGSLLDGTETPLDPVGTVARIPGAGRETGLLDLDVLQRSGSVLPRDAAVELWLDTDRPAVLSAVRRAMADVAPFETVRTVADARAERRRAVPAWSLQLGLFVGGAGLLITALTVLVVVLTTWRLRSRDLAALRMTGVRVRTLRRAAVAEQVIPVLAGALAGGASGWVGAHLALPLVPLFVTRPSVSTLDLATAWPAVAGGVAVGLVATVVPAYAAGRALARRAALGRLREPT